MIFFGKFCDTDRSLTHGCLEVQTSFSGNYNVCIGKLSFQIDSV